MSRYVFGPAFGYAAFNSRRYEELGCLYADGVGDSYHHFDGHILHSVLYPLVIGVRNGNIYFLGRAAEEEGVGCGQS